MDDSRTPDIGSPAPDGPDPRGRRFGWLVRRLVALGVTPNTVTVTGLAFALASAGCLALGAGDRAPWEAGPGPPASAWPLLAGAFLLGSALADLVDGDLARYRGMQTPFGAILDSTLDRLSDMAVLVGCAVHFASLGNATWTLVSCVALVHAVQISYVKARGENFVDGLGIGFWQRGERTATLLTGAFLGRMPAALFLAGIFPALTVGRRLAAARRRTSKSPSPDPAPPRSPWIAPWRARRRSPAYLLLCLAIAGGVWIAPSIHPFFLGVQDPVGEGLRALLGR